MKAMRLATLGEGVPFEMFDKPDAAPGPNEIAIRVKAAGVNPVDVKLRPGSMPIAPSAPHVFGCDAAGEVVAVGASVTRFAEGDAVYGCAGGLVGRDGSYSQRMVGDARLFAKKPANLSFREAAALPLVAITAWEALVDRARVQAGERVLVHGGTGGVGHIGVQLAKAAGAVVYTTVSTPEKAAIARRLGADETINYREQDVVELAGSLPGGGFDVVFDTIGGDNIASSIAALANYGRCATTVSIEATPDLTPLHLKSASLHVIFMLIPMLTSERLDHHGEILTRVANLVDAGRITPLVDDKRFTLEQVDASHEYLMSGKAIGKVVLDID